MIKAMVLLHIPGASCFLWLLFAMLIPLLLGLLLGYWLWGKYLEQVSVVEKERDDYHRRYVTMEKELAELKYKVGKNDKDDKALRKKLHDTEADLAVALNKLKSLQGPSSRSLGLIPSAYDYAAMFDKKDLQIIEGIGPKVEEVLKAAGVVDWSALAGKTPEQILALLSEAGDAFKMLNPASWPRQAHLAAIGQWKELVEYQHFLDAGRETTGDFENPSKVETLAERMMGKEEGGTVARGLQARSYTGLFKPTELQIIEGIGPKIEGVLQSADYKDWGSLGQATTEELKAVLEKAGSAYKMHDPSSWPRQAQLASTNKWEELVIFQKFLNAGKETDGHEDTPSKVETLAAAKTGFSGKRPEELQIIEGIGPRIEELLNAAGIHTWMDLASTTTDELHNIIHFAGKAFRLARPESWPVQAKLATEGNWKALHEYQEFLKAGGDPK